MNVIIYGKPDCKDCNKTKMLCEIKSIKYEYFTVGKDISMEQLQERVGKPFHTVPQIFVMADGFAEYVGGYNELREKLG